MLFKECFIMAIKALLANKMRSLLTMLGVIIGVAAVIALVSVGMGVRTGITSNFESLGANTITIMPGSLNRGGPRGAAAVFGPQKGADEAMVQTLDANLLHLAGVIERCLGKQIAHLPGAGAAGGMGGGMVAFLGSTLQMGIEVVPVPYNDVCPFGGALHCTTLDVYREGVCEDYFPNQIPGY